MASREASEERDMEGMYAEFTSLLRKREYGKALKIVRALKAYDEDASVELWKRWWKSKEKYELKSKKS